MRSTRSRTTSENADAVGLIIALLVRFPQIATLTSHPGERTLTLSFAVERRLDRATQRDLREAILEHVRAYAGLAAEPFDTVEVACEADERMTFVRVTRDARSVSREELQLVTALFAERFGSALVQSAVAEDEALDDDVAAQDELVEYALEALRDPSQQKSLVGFREEKRVLVYFTTARKKAKARARS
jgi:hypothetical protein